MFADRKASILSRAGLVLWTRMVGSAASRFSAPKPAARSRRNSKSSTRTTPTPQPSSWCLQHFWTSWMTIPRHIVHLNRRPLEKNIQDTFLINQSLSSISALSILFSNATTSGSARPNQAISNRTTGQPSPPKRHIVGAVVHPNMF